MSYKLGSTSRAGRVWTVQKNTKKTTADHSGPTNKNWYEAGAIRGPDTTVVADRVIAGRLGFTTRPQAWP
jgi:hypothetical protein